MIQFICLPPFYLTDRMTDNPAMSDKWFPSLQGTLDWYSNQCSPQVDHIHDPGSIEHKSLSMPMHMVHQHHQKHLRMSFLYSMHLLDCIGFEHTCGDCTVAEYN